MVFGDGGGQLGRGNQGRLLASQTLGFGVGGTPASTIPDINGTERRRVLNLSVYVLTQTLE